MTPWVGREDSGLLTFGSALPAEIDALVAIDRSSPKAWTREAFEAELLNSPASLFALRSSDQVVAFVVTRIQIPEMDIVNLAVARDHRGRGVGRLLVHSLLRQVAREGVQTVFLEVRESNLSAIRLYESAGFRETQRRRGFYRQPVEDAILMSLKIEP